MQRKTINRKLDAKYAWMFSLNLPQLPNLDFMNARVLFGFLMMCFLSLSSFGIDFSGVNIAWQYDPSFDVRMNHRVVKDDTGIHVFLEVVSDSINSWSYEFFLQRGYQSENHNAIKAIDVDTLSQIGILFEEKIRRMRS
ncbi:MAG: hypothetical protein AAFY41_07045 [Bacteroidota bacterium]